MNQILNINNNKSKLKNFFKIQFIISIVLIIFVVIFLFRELKNKEKENHISNVISINAKLNFNFLLNDNKIKEKENSKIYCGRIICEKINLDYYIFDKFSDENLKILPCKFYGVDFKNSQNICIMGHNYFDERFFSNIDKLEIGDLIKILDSDENLFEYSVYKKYDISEDEINKVIKPQKNKEITLCTCTFNKNKRFVVRAKRI